MINAEQIAKLLQAPVENTAVDYKLRVSWSHKPAQFELLRDLACLANRSGGFIGVGVREIKGSAPEVVGLAPDDPLPDVTELAQLFREYFGPTVPVEVHRASIDGKTIGIIAAGAFSGSPVICRKNGIDGSRVVLRRGAIYVRSDAAACEEASPEDVDRVLNRALEHRAAAFRTVARTLGESTQTPTRSPVQAAVPSETGIGPFTHQALAPDVTLRAADLFTLEPLHPSLRLSEIETLLERSRVRAGGGTVFPRYVDRIGSSYVVVFRHPDRLELSAGADASDPQPHMTIVASLTRAGVVRVRETLWEDVHLPLTAGSKRVGIVAMIRFALASLLFSYRYFGALRVAKVGVRIGLVAPAGRHLLLDSDRRWPLDEAYRATTSEDLILERQLELGEIDTLEKRKEIAFSLTSELLDYFGFRLTRGLFNGLVEEIPGELDGEPPTPLRP